MDNILIPGFVTLFKDNNNLIHLYFFPGIDNLYKNIYRDLDLSNSNIKYKRITYEDNAIEFIFKSNKILKITCKLVHKYENNKNKEITLYI